MEDLTDLYFSEKEDWRQWLSVNHNKSKGIWLLFFKKETGKPTLEYSDAVEEALCFGWIDGIIKNIDQERYVRKFTPRTNLFNWSPTNRKRAEKMISTGKMTRAGLLKIGNFAKTEKLEWPANQDNKIPQNLSTSLHELLCQNKLAATNFRNLSPSHQKRYIMWIMSAKTEETRLKRMNEAILLLEKNVKSLMK